MKYGIYIVKVFLIFILFNSCESKKPNVDKSGVDELESLVLDHQLDNRQMDYNDTIYVPIYSNIYVDTQNQKCLLAATLSIRNTSYSDSLFVTKIDYFNSEGSLVKSYIDNPISLPPMATVNYVIEKEDDTGGAGANFIVSLTGKHKHVNPIVQAIMVGQNGGNQGFSFTTHGYSIKKGDE